MYFNCFQSGHSIELFNPNNRDLLSNWKFLGNNYKTYDNLLRCSMYVLDSGGLSKMQLPSNPKHSLGILQSYLVFQLYLFSPKQFSIEIAISDTKNVKRRLIFSTHLREITSNHFSSLIPVIDLPLGVWINLSIDVLSFVSDCFKFLTFKSIDSICLSANCKVRKIFTMRNKLICDNDSDSTFIRQYQEDEGNKKKNELQSFNDNEEQQQIPLNLDLPSRANAISINLNVYRVNDQLRLKKPKKKDELNTQITQVNTTNNQRSVIRYNNKDHSYDKDYSKRISPLNKYIYIKNYSKSPIQKPFNQISETNDYAKRNNFLVKKKPKKKKLKNKKHTENKSSLKENQDQFEYKKGNKANSNNNGFHDKYYNNPSINLQLPSKSISNATEKRYQENNNPNAELKDSLIVQHQSNNERKKIAQLNNFFYNSKDFQKQNTVESNLIEEINVYNSQISLIKRESGIIHIDDITGKDKFKNQSDVTEQTKELYKYIQSEKEYKKKLLNEMLNDNPLTNLNKKSTDRPYSPPITNHNKDDSDNNNNSIDFFDNLKIADSITLGGKYS